jgi:hypothetical protein
VDEPLSLQQPFLSTAGVWRTRLAQEIAEALRDPAQGNRAEMLSVIGRQAAMRYVAQGMRFFEYRVEHRREVAWRRIDDPQYLGGGRLLLQGFVTLRFALVTLGFALGKLTLQIGYELLGIG